MRLLFTFLSMLFLSGCLNNQPENTAEEMPKEIPATSVPADTLPKRMSNIEFGIGSENGEHLLMLEADSAIEAPERFTKALVRGGQLVDIRFLQENAGTGENSGRQVENNFDHMEGYLFKTEKAIPNEDQTVVFLTPSFFKDKKQILWEPLQDGSLKASERKRLESDKGRSIKNSKGLIQTEKGGRVFLVEFERQEQQAFAVLAFIYKDRIVYKDFPAEYDPQGTWRVDDEGEFGMEYFNILGIFESPAGLEVVTEWLSTEGYYIQFLTEKEGALLEADDFYRYSSPF